MREDRAGNCSEHDAWRCCEAAGLSSSFSMPTVLRRGPYRFFLFSSDRPEPVHVHVERDDKRAKYWLDPVRLHESGGFRNAELNGIASVVEENHDILLRAWREYFGE